MNEHEAMKRETLREQQREKHLDRKYEDSLRGKETITPQPTEQKPLTVEDYPYGFRLRTKAQYWIETTKRGQRIVFRTLNPKTQQWNKPKKSIYSDILMLYRNTENGHIENDSLSFTYSRKEDLEKFLAEYPEDTLSEYQQKQIIYFRAILRTREHVKVNLVENPTPQQTEQIDQNNKETSEDLRKIFRHYYIDEKRKKSEK